MCTSREMPNKRIINTLYKSQYSQFLCVHRIVYKMKRANGSVRLLTRTLQRMNRPNTSSTQGKKNQTSQRTPLEEWMDEKTKQQHRTYREKRQKRATESFESESKCSMKFQFGSYTIEGDGASTYLLRLFGVRLYVPSIYVYRTLCMYRSTAIYIFPRLFGVCVCVRACLSLGHCM